MKWTVGLVSLAAVATAQDCQSTYNGAFEYAVAVPGKRDLAPRFACAENALVATLKNGILKDSKDRQGEIVANSQFQFDPILQPDALETEGFSICGNRLAVKGSTKFFRCLSGKFYNLYTKSQGKQCEEISLAIFPCGGADNGAAPVTQIGDGQAQAPSNVVSQIGDGQAQAPTGGVVTQIGDGQLQAPTGGVVTQIGDGQAQAPTGVVTQIGDGQAQAPTGVVTQIGDGQAQAPTGVVTQIGDGQAQAPTGIVTQIGDGQAQAPTGTPVAVGPNAGNKIIPGTFAALFVGLVGTVLYL